MVHVLYVSINLNFKADFEGAVPESASVSLDEAFRAKGSIGFLPEMTSSENANDKLCLLELSHEVSLDQAPQSLVPCYLLQS